MVQVGRRAAPLLAAVWFVHAPPAAASPGDQSEWPLTCAGFSFTCAQEGQALPLSRKEYQQGLSHLDEAARALLKSLGDPPSARLAQADIAGVNIRATPFVLCGWVWGPAPGPDGKTPATDFTIFFGAGEPRVTLASCAKYFKEHRVVTRRAEPASPRDDFQKALDAAIAARGSVGR